MQFQKENSINLVPEAVNPSPDYFCTWQTQLYFTCGGSPADQRANITEKNIFSKNRPAGPIFIQKSGGT